jgi:tetratricopeptide (TPR) repeat protein
MILKKLMILFIIVSVCGCSAFRETGQPYHGYSCHESLIHYHSYCTKKEFAKGEFEALVEKCENDLKTGICDKEFADLLWCQGRTWPGTYSKGSGIAVGAGRGLAVSTVSGGVSDGCDCDTFEGALKECRMRAEISPHAPAQAIVSTPVANSPSLPHSCLDSAHPWLERSRISANERNWSETIRTSSAAINADSKCADAYAIRSWAYLEKGFREQSIADAEKALSIDPKNMSALNNRGLYHLREGDKEKAKSDFEKSCSAGLEVGCENFRLAAGYKPSEKVSYNLEKAETAFNSKNWDEVVLYTSEIPDNATALSVRAGAYANMGKIEEAINDCERAIKMNPDYPLPYNNKAFALETRGNIQEAILNYEFACNLKMPLACNNLKRLQK